MVSIGVVVEEEAEEVLVPMSLYVQDILLVSYKFPVLAQTVLSGLMSIFLIFASFKLPHIDIIRDAVAGRLGT